MVNGPLGKPIPPLSRMRLQTSIIDELCSSQWELEVKMMSRPMGVQINRDVITVEPISVYLIETFVSARAFTSFFTCCVFIYASINKEDTDWFNLNDVMVHPNAHWSAHHLHLELPLAGAEFADDSRLQPHPGERGEVR